MVKYIDRKQKLNKNLPSFEYHDSVRFTYHYCNWRHSTKLLKKKVKYILEYVWRSSLPYLAALDRTQSWHYWRVSWPWDTDRCTPRTPCPSPAPHAGHIPSSTMRRWHGTGMRWRGGDRWRSCGQHSCNCTPTVQQEGGSWGNRNNPPRRYHEL